MSAELEEWLRVQNAFLREREAFVEQTGNDFQIVTVIFDRPAGVALEAPVHTWRIANVDGTPAIDALIESASSDVIRRDLDPEYPHKMIMRRELDGGAA